MRSAADDDPTLTLDFPLSVDSTGGITVVVHDLGGHGPPVLLCHATGFHGRVWLPVARHLPFHSLAPDLRGHGDSPVPADATMAWERFADDVLAVVDALALTDVMAAGHSKGGAALLLAEQRRPGTFRALYCYEPIVFPPLPEEILTGPNPLADGALRRRTTFASFEAAIENYASKLPFSELDPDVLDAYVRYGFAADDDGIHLKCRPEIESKVYRMGGQHGAFARLGEITCPVTVAAGESTPYTPAAMAPAIADALPHGMLEEYPDLGHFGPLQDPARIAGRITACFNSVPR